MPFFPRPGFTLGGNAGNNDSFLLQQRGAEAQSGFFHFSQYNGYQPGVGSPPPDPPPQTGTNPGIPRALYDKWSGDAGFLVGVPCSDPADYIGTMTKKTYDGPPRHAINTTLQCTEVYGFAGEPSIPTSAQLVMDIDPVVGPGQANMVTSVVHFRYPGPHIEGGKAMQNFTSDNHGIRLELGQVFNFEPDNITLNNALTQHRIYKADAASIGGTGRNGQLSVPYSGGGTAYNVMPGLLHIPEFSGTEALGAGFWDYDYNRDHIYSPGFTPGGIGAFLVRTGQWYRVIVTRDFQDGDGTLENPFRLWCWLESETDPRTLYMADDPANGFRGFPFNYRSPWLEDFDGVNFCEFNNSTSIATADFTIQVRDVFAIRDVWGGDL